MKVKWLGHASFLLTASDGTRIVTDPYVSGSFGNTLRYGPIDVQCDAVTESHSHEDHAGGRMLPGKPKVIRSAGEHTVKSVTITGFDTAHDQAGGSQRGRNTVFVFRMDGLKVCHLGDLGEPLSLKVAAAIGQVDVLLVPVGGSFTIDAAQAHKAAEQLRAHIAIPMHFKTDKCSFTIEPVDTFIKGRTEAKKMGVSEMEITKDKLPQTPEIWVLNHAL